MIVKSGSYSGTVTVPASKSQTIRALLIALFARGVSHIAHPLISSDTLSALSILEALGADVTKEEDGGLTVDSRDAFRYVDEAVLDCGNSGTSLLLSMPMAASLGIPVTFTGDGQLSRRPVAPLMEALEALGAETERGDTPLPLTIRGPLDGGECSIECPTSQYLSGLLLGAPLATGESHIRCTLLNEKPYVRMTLKWLDRQGISYRIKEDLEEAWIPGGQCYRAMDSYIEGDFSSASFFFVLAAIQGESITVEGLDPDSVQGDKAILDILAAMGAKVEWKGMAVTVTGCGKLHGGAFDLNAIPDTLPALAVAAAAAEGDTLLHNVAQARIKETDRISVMCSILRELGVGVEEREDGILIHGNGHIRGGKTLPGHGDHRVIMALSVAATVADGPVGIDDTAAAAVTFPTFFTLLESLRKE